MTVPSGDQQPAQQFSSIISTLRQTYPRDKMSEISTSFCFICLLHLANEEGLGIESARMDGKEGEDVGCVGVLEEDDDEEEGVEEGLGTGMGRGGRAGGAKRKMDEGEKRDRVVGELQALRVWKDPNAGRAA